MQIGPLRAEPTQCVWLRIAIRSPFIVYIMNVCPGSSSRPLAGAVARIHRGADPQNPRRFASGDRRNALRAWPGRSNEKLPVFDFRAYLVAMATKSATAEAPAESYEQRRRDQIPLELRTLDERIAAYRGFIVAENQAMTLKLNELLNQRQALLRELNVVMGGSQ